MRHFVVILAVLGMSAFVSASLFVEGFESYSAGSDLHGQGGWKGWNNDPAAGSPASNAFANSGTNSVAVIGSADLVHEFDIAGGLVEFTAMQYIPRGGSGESYFILLNRYSDSGTQAWSVQIRYDLASGVITSDNGGGATGNIVYDKWVELKFMIDLANNSVSEYYNGSLLSTHAWYDTNDGNAGGYLQAIDLFGNGASTVYYDDLSIVPEPMTLSILGLGGLALLRKRK
jgi:hypothetical protein